MQYLRPLYGAWVMTWLAACLALLLAGCLPAQPPAGTGQAPGGMATTIVVKGRVSRVRPATNQLFIKPDKEKEMLVLVNRQTFFSGFDALSELARDQVLTIWYYRQGANNIAIRVERRLEQSC